MDRRRRHPPGKPDAAGLPFLNASKGSGSFIVFSVERAVATAGTGEQSDFAARVSWAPASLACLAAVFGDIGTSRLYMLGVVAKAARPGGTVAPEAMLGMVSLIFWSLIVPKGLELAVTDGQIDKCDLQRATYYTGHETIIPSGGRAGMARWRDGIFAFMHRNAQRPSAYFKILSEQLMEIGIELEV